MPMLTIIQLNMVSELLWSLERYLQMNRQYNQKAYYDAEIISLFEDIATLLVQNPYPPTIMFC